MRRPFVLFGVFALLIVGVLALGAIVGDRDWGGRHNHNDGRNVTIVNPGTGGTIDGQSVQPGSVVVIDNGRRGPGFFPFLLIPLGFLLFFGFTRMAWGGGYRRGPGGWGGPSGPGGPSRFDRAPQDAQTTPQPGTTPASPTSTPAAPTEVASPAPTPDTTATGTDDADQGSPA